MAYVFAYTRRRAPFCDKGHPDNYGTLQGRSCDLDDAMHLALSEDGAVFTPLRNNTGVLFPAADLDNDIPGGVTKTLIDPWLFRREDGSFGVIALRRNQDAPDPLSAGCAMLFASGDLVRFTEAGFLPLSDGEIRRPRCRWDAEAGVYRLEWETEAGAFSGWTRHFMQVHDAAPIPAVTPCAGDFGIPDAVPGNLLEIDDREAAVMARFLGEIRNTAVEIPRVDIAAGETPVLPRALCRYSDGSVHEKPVEWDRAALEAIDLTRPGTYTLPGRVAQKHFPFPYLDANISDPCICRWQGRYFLSGSGRRGVVFRISETLEGLASAAPVEVYTMPDHDTEHSNMWAPEMHIIKGVPYVFTTVGGHAWNTVRAHVLRCSGDPADPHAWEAPRLVLRPDGSELQGCGISLDMTYFCVAGVHYVMWSDRVIRERDGDRAVADTADICIAVIDPDAPWQLVTQPVRILRPIYGWDRCQTEVDEGPYILRRGDDIYITIAGASTGLADLYCVGLLHTRADRNLLDPAAWDWLGYPVLTKESVPGEFGPGHNSFLPDPDTGDDLLIYHAVPHRPDGRTLGRHMGIRRVHWTAAGLPCLEMTEEKDLDPALREVTCTLHIH